MAGSVSAEVWLNQRRWDALEESLKAQFRARLYPGTALIKQKRRHHDGT